MLRANTQFERVPVALAKKILADELERNRIAERLQISTAKDSHKIPAGKIAVQDLTETKVKK